MSDSEVYEVEAIIKHRGKNKNREYFVKWLGYDASNNTWEPAENLADAKLILDKYLNSIKKSSNKRTSTTKKSSRTLSNRQDTSNDFDSDDDESELFISGKKKTIIVSPPRKTRRGDPSDSVDEEEPQSRARRPILLRGDTPSDEDIDNEYMDNTESAYGDNATDDATDTTNTIDNNGVTDSDEFADIGGATYDVSNESNDEDNDGVVVGADGLTRMPYTLKINGEEKDIQMIMDKDYPSGDFNWEDRAKRIVGIFGTRDDQGGMTGIIEWENGDYSVHKLQQLHVRCPITLIEFYESHASYKSYDSDAQSDTESSAPRKKSRRS